ncbi:hypothetical protein S40285_10030 [Stachybotrys chlorohalonatus IBT 40285]|uniref:DUF2293 domain-containing protein n=1 Tax=Stachybotrys chlorohalonatus (strain IBT 40285) TaxID=1283841 RepID=A0A084QN00_STAC4|nr:hypothetical protein S40285_10030 [Stachybotrys chlorohalonata IBT 40285]
MNFSYILTSLNNTLSSHDRPYNWMLTPFKKACPGLEAPSLLTAMPLEPVVRMGDPMPTGYSFLKTGNRYKTASCRRSAHANQQTLYVVKDKSKVLGVRAPASIIGDVHQAEFATRPKRQAATERRDKTLHDKFSAAIKKLYSQIASQAVLDIIKHTLKKHSGRVGRTSRLSMDRKTDYNKPIRETKDRVKARKAVFINVSRKLQEWRVGLIKATSPRTKVAPKKLAGKVDEPRKAKPVTKESDSEHDKVANKED